MEPSAQPTENAPEDRKRARIFMGLAVLAVLLVYFKVVDNQLLDWDDSENILGNTHIRHLDLSSLKWMFTDLYPNYWIPLTWFSFALDFAVGRLEPWVYHLDNLILHCLNTALVFGVSTKFMAIVRKNAKTQWLSAGSFNEGAVAFGTALLFGLHPLHVESVAWASERKDVLCGFFYLSSLWFYLDYAVQLRSRKLWVSLGLFLAALMAKPMAISLPFVLLLFDWWPLGRLQTRTKGILKEKIPFLATALGVTFISVAFKTQYKSGMSLESFPFPTRLPNACHAIVFYLLKMACPTKLAAFYPFLVDEAFSPPYLFSVFLVLALTAICFIYRKKVPYLPVAWFFYLVTLAPVLGIITVGSHGAADRYTYLPALGPFLLFSAGLVRFFSGKRGMLMGLAFVLTVLLGYGTYLQVAYWKDTVTLWEKAFRDYPKNNVIRYFNLGFAYEETGRLDDALRVYSAVIKENPYFFRPYWRKAVIYSLKGHLDDSIKEFQAPIQMNPSYAPLHSDLSQVYLKSGMTDKAQVESSEAIQLDPHYAEAYNSLGMVKRYQGNFQGALEDFQKARSLDPDNPVYFRNLVEACLKAGKPQEALALYRELSAHPRSLLSLSF